MVLSLVAAALCRRPRSLASLQANGAWASCMGGPASIHTHSSSSPLGLPAFVFDIDGVLIKGKHVLPATKQAMDMLSHGGAFKYPVVFMTNGGGCTEEHKAKQLSEWLGVQVNADQIILSHTPMRSLATRFGSSPVLVAGRGDIAHVAETYGFKRAVTTEQLWHRLGSNATPFMPPTKSGSPPPPPAPADLGTLSAPFEAIMVLNDPANWYINAQLIIDTLTAHGVPDACDPQPGSKAPELFFSNPDLLWANEFPRARLGQGAFAHMVLSLYRELTGRPDFPFPIKFFGKPNPEPYHLAEQMLAAQAAKILGHPPPAPPTSLSGAAHEAHPNTTHTDAYQVLTSLTSHASNGAHSKQAAPAVVHSHPPAPRPPLPVSAIYAVGDNPAADVRGANLAGSPWVSVLVKTGVFRGPGANCTRDTAAISVDDVAGAVSAAMHRTRSLRWFSMR